MDKLSDTFARYVIRRARADTLSTIFSGRHIAECWLDYNGCICLSTSSLSLN